MDGVKSVDNVTVSINSATREAVIKYTVTTESKERFEREVNIWNMA